MALRTLVTNLDEILKPLYDDPSSIAALEFDGDGTVIKQNPSGNAWDINPAKHIIKNLSAIAGKGHALLLSSAREVEETAGSLFKTIPNIHFQGNDGTETWDGEKPVGPPRPDFSNVLEHMRKTCGSYVDIRYHNMGQRWGAQCWPDQHDASGDIQAALTAAIPMIRDPQERTFICVKVEEGFYLVPTVVPGKWRGFEKHCAGLEREGNRIGLKIACGNGGNDRQILTEVGSRDNGLAFWVGTEDSRPEGKHVFCVPNEDALSTILGALAAELPDRVQR
jgi:hypothetical protein